MIEIRHNNNGEITMTVISGEKGLKLFKEMLEEEWKKYLDKKVSLAQLGER